MKLAVVVQRYGVDISGGAELHARYIAEHLASHADVRVFTTCARDYITWANALPPGESRVNGVAVERFPVARERARDLREFGLLSTQVFSHPHSIADELRWIESEGPMSPALLRRLRVARDEFDFVIVFSLRYYTAYYAARTVPSRAVLVPTAEREASLGLAIFGPVLRGVRAIMYNSLEEMALIHGIAGNQHVPASVVGVGSDIPDSPDAGRARRRFALHNRFVVYMGRIDANKGCAELFEYFVSYLRVSHLTLRDRELDLVLVGTALMDIPPHPHIRHLGFLSDADKFDVLAAADALVMPSYYESLSMVTLEAWALGKPVVANARCDVLAGQCIRSNAGLYYENAKEFAAALDTLLDSPALAARMGDSGRRFFREHYSWPVIERKYLQMFARLTRTPASYGMEPMPGFFARRQRSQAPAADRVSALPTGPARSRAITEAAAG